MNAKGESIIVNRIADWCKYGKKKAMVLKIDIEKLMTI